MSDKIEYRDYLPGHNCIKNDDRVVAVLKQIRDMLALAVSTPDTAPEVWLKTVPKEMLDAEVSRRHHEEWARDMRW